MRKKLSVLLITIMTCALLTACQSSMSYTWKMDNGEKVETKLDTSDGWKIKTDGTQFTVSNESGTVCNGALITGEGYDYYMDELDGAGVVEIINGTDYIRWYYDSDTGTENDCIARIPGTSYYVLIGSQQSWDDLTEALNKLTLIRG